MQLYHLFSIISDISEKKLFQNKKKSKPITDSLFFAITIVFGLVSKGNSKTLTL